MVFICLATRAIQKIIIPSKCEFLHVNSSFYYFIVFFFLYSGGIIVIVRSGDRLEAAMQRLTNLCSVLNDMEPICVLNHVFVLREVRLQFQFL